MRTLRRYLAREIVAAIVFVMAALVSLFAFFDLIGELDDLGRGNYRLLKVIGFVLLNLPGHVYELFPIAVLIGTLFALAQLAASSEFTVMRASGVSAAKMAWALVQTGLVFAGLTFAFGEFVAPAAEQLAQRVRAQAIAGVIAQEFVSGLWVKDERNFINVKQVMPDASLSGVHIYEFDDQLRLRVLSVAQRGEYRGNNTWRLTELTQTRFDGKRAVAVKIDEAMWHSVLDPGMVDLLMIAPERMSAWALNQYIQHLRENRQRTLRHEIAFWLKLTYPFAVLVMIVLALPFAYFQQRVGSVGAKIFVGIMVGLAYHTLNRVTGHLAQINDWPPVPSAVLPTIVFLMVAVTMLWWVERR